MDSKFEENSVLRQDDRLSGCERRVLVILGVVFGLICLIGIVGWVWLYSHGIVIPFWKFFVKPTPVVPIHCLTL